MLPASAAYYHSPHRSVRGHSFSRSVRGHEVYGARSCIATFRFHLHPFLPQLTHNKYSLLSSYCRKSPNTIYYSIKHHQPNHRLSKFHAASFSSLLSFAILTISSSTASIMSVSALPKSESFPAPP